MLIRQHARRYERAFSVAFLALALSVVSPVASAGKPETPPSEVQAQTGQDVLIRAIRQAQGASSTAEKPESRCFTIGSDEPLDKDGKLVIPRQTICPFVRLPRARN